MQFNKNDLKKIAKDVRDSGVEVSRLKNLQKKASLIKIAYLTAYIKK